MSECSVKHLKWGATWPSRGQFHELADAGYRVIPIVRRSARRLAHPGRLLRASRRRPIRHLHPRIGGIRRHVEPLQLHRRQLEAQPALQQRSGPDWLGKVPVGVPVTGDVVEVAHATLRL